MAQEDHMPTAQGTEDTEVVTSISMPRCLRLALEEVRVARARRARALPPRLREIVVEALQQFVQRETAR